MRFDSAVLTRVLLAVLGLELLAALAALAALARWLWEQSAEPRSARDAARYAAANRGLFQPPTEAEAAAAALVRRLLG